MTESLITLSGGYRKPDLIKLKEKVRELFVYVTITFLLNKTGKETSS